MDKQSSLSVLGKLVDLKQWQSRQHEKLVKEQEKHREILVEEQSTRFQQLKFVDQMKDLVTYDGDSSVSVISNEETTFDESINIDLTKPSPNESFQHGVDERNFASISSAPKEEVADCVKPKRPFLKRGEGLSRFRMSNEDVEEQKKRIIASKAKKKANSNSDKDQKQKVLNNVPPKPPKDKKAETKKAAAIDDLKKNRLVPRAPIPSTLKLVPPKKNLFHEKKMQQDAHKTEKTAALPERKFEDAPLQHKPIPPSTWSSVLAKPQQEISTSSPMRKIEQRELRVFERMEKLADDSSFCSSSSVYTRFIEGGYVSSVQNTPQGSPAKQPRPQVQSPLALEPSPSTSNPAIENAKALLQQLAAIRFGPSDGAAAEFWENNKGINLNDLKLDLSGLNSETSSEEDDDRHNPIDLTEEEWSKTSNSSDSETSTDISEYGKKLEDVQKKYPPRELETTLLEESHDRLNQSISSEEESQDLEDGLKLGSEMHTRLEQLHREVLVVQDQQSQLQKQKADLAGEQEKLAKALEEAEEQKRKFRGTKIQQQHESRKIEELKKQLQEMQDLWKDKEVRWASAQASQRAQLRQLAQENKNLAMQIKELKLYQAKKVHFALAGAKSKAPPKSALKKQTEVKKPPSPEAQSDGDEAEESGSKQEGRITCARDLDDALKLYQKLCPKEVSPNSSIMTPRSINKAYYDIFYSNKESSPDTNKSKSKSKSDDTPPKEVEKPACQESCEQPREPILSQSVSPEVHSNEKLRPKSILPERMSQPNRISEATSDIVKSENHPDGTRQIWYSCGNTLKVSADGCHRRMVFYNGDVQESWKREGISRYFYADSRVWHETNNDGTQTISYPDGQKEVLKIDGSKEVTFPDGSSMCIGAEGKQTANLSDGSKLFLNLDGSSVLEMPNGLREIRTADSTTLQYPDGTIRVQYPSGLLETKYPNGRVRVKDASGKLIIDTHCPVDS